MKNKSVNHGVVRRGFFVFLILSLVFFKPFFAGDRVDLFAEETISKDVYFLVYQVTGNLPKEMFLINYNDIKLKSYLSDDPMLEEVLDHEIAKERGDLDLKIISVRPKENSLSTKNYFIPIGESIFVVEAYDFSSSVGEKDLLKKFRWAKEQNIRVVNLSLGGTEYINTFFPSSESADENKKNESPEQQKSPASNSTPLISEGNKKSGLIENKVDPESGLIRMKDSKPKLLGSVETKKEPEQKKEEMKEHGKMTDHSPLAIPSEQIQRAIAKASVLLESDRIVETQNKGLGKQSIMKKRFDIREIPGTVPGYAYGRNVQLNPSQTWYAYEYPTGADNGKTWDGRYKIAVGPGVLDYNYSDWGKIWTSDFTNLNRNVDLLLKNKYSGEIKILNCLVTDVKAHTFNHLNNDIIFNIPNGLVQTGIAYPNSWNYKTQGPFAGSHVDGSVVEFIVRPVDFVMSDYILKELRVY